MEFHSTRKFGGAYSMMLAGISAPPWSMLIIEQEYLPSGSFAMFKAR